MKIDARQIRFMPSGMLPTRRRPRLIGKTNTMQLMETALVIEGYQKTIGFPVIDMLFQRALSEFTTLTVPYSRIERFQYRRNLWVRITLLALVWSPLSLVLIGAINSEESWAVSLVAFVIPSIVLFALTIYVVNHLFGPRFDLSYRGIDEKLIYLRFRIRPKAVRLAFADRLSSNRVAASAARLKQER